MNNSCLFLTLRRLFSPSCAKSLDTFIVYKFISNARRLTFDEATRKRREAGTPPSSDTLYCHPPSPPFLPSSSSSAPSNALLYAASTLAEPLLLPLLLLFFPLHAVGSYKFFVERCVARDLSASGCDCHGFEQFRCH